MWTDVTALGAESANRSNRELFKAFSCNGGPRAISLLNNPVKREAARAECQFQTGLANKALAVHVEGVFYDLSDISGPYIVANSFSAYEYSAGGVVIRRPRSHGHRKLSSW